MIMSTSRSAPDAYAALTAAILAVPVAVGRAHADDLPGLLEFAQDKFVPNIGRPTKNYHGWFHAESWRNGTEYVAEIYVSVDTRDNLPPAELAVDILHTIIHELAHAWNYINGVTDTSRGGRYHGRKFAEVAAIALDLKVERDPGIGHRTVGIQDRLRRHYADELRALADALTLVWSPNPSYHAAGPAKPRKPGKSYTPSNTHKGITPWNAKYVSASCDCTDGHGNRRTIRVASGWWLGHAPIKCEGCGSAFRLGEVDGVSSTSDGYDAEGGEASSS